ncbi:hypothetical protein SAMN05216359_101330 [Roseateles sp. YR242]|uniref:hypothetical protein n=1 Tax=Roseateles sp. YR242 TaxID=1855305 RepID=UPI0008C387D2|nr:hypothetical protein [Roseateles sp. YR242]SEK29607.1 hypothetical protein SAMN05216359_101330 [Roseateles sp. YR242]
MKLKLLATAAVGAAALVLGQTPEGTLSVMSQAAAQVRPDVGKHLKAASDLLKAGKAPEALAKLREAEAVPGRNADENAALEGLRISAASRTGDADAMVKGFDALNAAGRLPAAQKLPMMEAIAGTYLRIGNTAKALDWSNKYFAAGGNSPTMKQVQTQAQMKSGDVGPMLKDALAEIQADEKAGRTPAQQTLNTALWAADKKGDGALASQLTQKLLNYYPTPRLWSVALSGLQSKKGFSASRYQLDVLRLRLVTDNMTGANDYMELAQLAGAAGFPEEGKKVVEKGFAAGVLKPQDDNGRPKRLADLLDKRIQEAVAAQAANEQAARSAREGDDLVKLGLALVQRGQKPAGLKLIDDGIAKGNFKRPDDAKLYQGLAQYLAGETSKAQATWRNVKGTDGSADLAGLWLVVSRSGKK